MNNFVVLRMGDLVSREHLTLPGDIVMGTSGDMRDNDLCNQGSGVRDAVDSPLVCKTAQLIILRQKDTTPGGQEFQPSTLITTVNFSPLSP